MASLTVHVVDDDDNPVESANVFVVVHHNVMPDTWLEDTTDDDGEASFDFDGYYHVDIRVNDVEEYSDLSIAGEDVDVTVSI